MPATLAVITGTVTVLNGTFVLVQTIFKLKEVDEDLKICLKLLAITHRDLNHARYLRQRKSRSLQFSATDLDYIEAVINDMDAAALALGKLVEAYRIDREVNNSISIPRRFKWVMNGKDRFVARQSYLTMVHSSLLTVIHKLSAAPTAAPRHLAPPAYTPPSAPSAPGRDLQILRSPSQIRALRGQSSMVFHMAG